MVYLPSNQFNKTLAVSVNGTASDAYGNVSLTTIPTASYVTSSNVYGPYGSNSILSSSYALTASYAANQSPFPYTGSAAISGTLTIRNTSFPYLLVHNSSTTTSYPFITLKNSAYFSASVGSLVGDLVLTNNTDTSQGVISFYKSETGFANIVLNGVSGPGETGNNVLIGTITDSGYKLDVSKPGTSGALRVSGSTVITGSLTISGSTTITDVLVLPFQNPLPSNKPTSSIALSGSGGTFEGMYVYNGTSWIKV